MKTLNKVISVIIAVCFFGTNVLYAADIGTFKLAPPSKFTRLQGPEFKEAAQVEISARAALRELDSFTLNNLRALGVKKIIENSIFSKKITGEILFDRAKEAQILGSRVFIEEGNYIIKAKAGKGVYYCLVSKAEDAKPYNVTVVSERVLNLALKEGIVKFTPESIDEKDRSILDTYIEHEISTENNIAIDEWIRERMERGEYTVEHSIKEKNPLYQNAQNGIFLTQILPIIERISKSLEAVGVKKENIKIIEKALLSKPLVLIPYDGDSLPYIKIGGERVKVTAHSSPLATYIFIPRPLYDKSLVKYYAAGYRGWGKDIQDLIERELVHEIGAICGLKVKVVYGKAQNLLDTRVALLKTSEKIPSTKELENLAPVNLLELELRNDYAAGSIIEKKKSIFKRIIQVMLTVAITVFSSCNTPGPGLLDETSIIVFDTDSFAEDFTTDELIIKIFNESETCKELRKRQTVSEYMGTVGNRKAIGLFLSTLKNSKHGELRIKAAIALSRIVNNTDTDIVDTLITLLVKKSPFHMWDRERYYIVDALGAIGDERAVAAIFDFVKSERYNFALRCARRALIRIGPKSLPYIIEVLKNMHAESQEEQIKYKYVKRMIEFDVIPELVKKPDDETTVLLIRALDDKNDWIRNLASEVLSKKATAGVLISVLNDKDPFIRMTAVRLLGERFAWKALEPLEKILKESGNESEKKVVQDAINAIRLSQLLYAFSFHNTQGYRPENTYPLEAAVTILEMRPFATEKIIQILLNQPQPRSSIYDGARKMLLEILKDDDVVVKKVMQGILQKINEEPARVWILKRLFQEIPQDRFEKLIQEFTQDDRFFLSLFYFTNQSPSANEIGYGDFLHSKYKLLELKQQISDIFDTPLASKYLVELDKLNNMQPKKMRNLIHAIVAAHIYPDYMYAPAVPPYPYWAGMMLDDIRIVELAKRSTIVKLLAQMGYIHIPTKTYGDLYLRWAVLELSTISFDRNDIPALQRLLNSKHESYRDAAAEALTKIEQQKEKIETPATKPEGSSMLDEKPTIPKHIKTTMDNIGTAIPQLNTMRVITKERVDKITEILWKAGLGSISKQEAKAQLTKFAPQVATTEGRRNDIYNAWIAQAKQTMLAMSVVIPGLHKKPTDIDIHAIAATIKSMDTEVFVPSSQLPGDTTNGFRKTLKNIFGDRLRIYQKLEDLKTMIKNPQKSIIMTVDLNNEQIDLLSNININLNQVRFMNFEPVNVKTMTETEHENYIAEVLSILLVARAITPEDAKDEGSPMYQMLAHLLEGHMGDTNEIGAYIRTIADNSINPIAKLQYILETILKAMPVTAYRIMKPAVEILWSA